MAAVMMVGVWLLLNQHCCSASDVDGKVRIPLMDPLTRRSALEKNFMRFGRSWKSNDDGRYPVSPISQLSPSVQVETLAPTSLRLKLSLNRDNNRENGYDSAGQFYQAPNNLIKLEKVNPSRELNRMFKIQDEYERDARGSDNFMRFGRGGDNFMRFGRQKDNNFLRFGRAVDSGSRLTRSVDVGGRETRDKNLVRAGRQRQTDKADGFIRFGRRLGQSLRLVKRCVKDDDNSRPSFFCVHPPLITDPNALVAPELLLLPEVLHKPPLDHDFMRLG